MIFLAVIHIFLLTEIGVVAFAQSRASEIEALAREIKTNTGTRKLFQSLPIHMRRRAMSHNIKRLPRRLQKYATAEVYLETLYF